MPKSAGTPGLQAAQTVEIVQWDEFLEEAIEGIEPFRINLPTAGVVTVPCPTSDQLSALGAAQQSGNQAAIVVSVFGPELAPEVLTLTGDKPFTVALRLVGKVMTHYGLQAAQLPSS